jgi:hypothetical protein
LTRERPVSASMEIDSRILLTLFSCFAECPALSHRLAYWPRAHFDHANPVLVLLSSVGRHRNLLFDPSLPNLEDHGLVNDSRYNCGGTYYSLIRLHTAPNQQLSDPRPSSSSVSWLLVRKSKVSSGTFPYPSYLIIPPTRPLRLR